MAAHICRPAVRRTSQPTRYRPRPLVLARRGGTEDFPENTLPAIRQSLATGADGVWLSVQATRDGVPVLYRPAGLRELTDGSGTVGASTWSEIAGLNAGYRFAGRDGAMPYRRPGHGMCIPRLEEALWAVPEDRQIYLDLRQAVAEQVVDAVGSLLDRYDAWDRVRLHSTHETITCLLHRTPRARLSDHHACWGIRAAYSGVTPSTTHPGLPVVVYGVRTRADLAIAAALGARAVLVDSPRAVAGPQ